MSAIYTVREAAARSLVATLRERMPALARGDEAAWKALDRALAAYEVARKEKAT